MRYCIGVDWADAEHAKWIADEEGQGVSASMMLQSAIERSEWGRQLDEWRAQGIVLWMAIERLWHRALGRPASESGTLSPVAQAYGSGERRSEAPKCRPCFRRRMM